MSYDIKLGIGTLICYGSQIGHGVEIGKYCSLMPNVIINGNSKIGNKVKFGIVITITYKLRIIV